MEDKVRYRIATSVFFFVNGFLYANWVARLPELKKFFSINNSTLGTLLLMTAFGALVSMPMAGWFNKQWGNRTMTLISGVVFCCCIPLITVSPNLWMARLAFFSIGFGSGALDVSMNGQGVMVERLWSKSIMSSFHAVFSIGMATGAATGLAFSYAHIAISIQLLLMSALGVLALIIASKHLLNTSSSEPDIYKERKSVRSFLSVYILVISIIAFCGMTGEGSMSDWSAIYMHTIGGKSESFSGIAFFSFSAAMTIGRLTGDYFINRAGRQKLLLINCFIAICGLSLALAIPSVFTIILGFFMIGIGLSTIVPVVYSTAGNIKDIDPSAGIAVASTIGYTGFFIGPPTIGYLSDHFGLRVALCYPLLLFVVMFLLVRRFVR